jgi:predicted PurR-regulated permease PerM
MVFIQTSITESIPMTAWEQVVVVCLFAVVFISLIVYLLGWFSKQQDNWQGFIQKRDVFWQDWLEKSNDNTTDAMKSVTSALQNVNEGLHSLALQQHALSEQLTKHDDKVDDKFSDAVKEVQKVSNGHGNTIVDRRKAQK